MEQCTDACYLGTETGPKPYKVTIVVRLASGFASDAISHYSILWHFTYSQRSG